MRALVIAALVLTACNPSLHGDGYYRCARAGQCPPTAPFCGSDGVCHESPVDAAVVDASASDVGIDSGVAPYADCTMTHTCVGTDHCYDYSIAPDDTAYCTTHCTTSNDCPDYLGLHSSCGSDGYCRRACSGGSDSSCPYPMVCARGRWDGTSNLAYACASFDEIMPATFAGTCTRDLDCPAPLSCLASRCTRPCTTSADCLPAPLEDCQMVPGGMHACLFECMGDPTVCVGSTCTGNPSACRPPGW